MASAALCIVAVILLLLAALPLAGSERVQAWIRCGSCLAAIVLIAAAVWLMPPVPG